MCWAYISLSKVWNRSSTKRNTPFPLFSIKYFLGQFFSLMLNIRSTLKTVNSNFQFLLIIRRNLFETHRIETSKRNMVFVKQVNICVSQTEHGKVECDKWIMKLPASSLLWESSYSMPLNSQFRLPWLKST